MTIEELKVVITAEIGELKQAMKQVTNSVNGVSGNIVKQTNKVTNSVKSSIKSLNSSFKSLGSVIAKAVSTVALLKVGADAIQVASDLAEAQNVVNVAFGSMAAQAEYFAKKCAKAFGLSELVAKQTSSTFMAMAKGMDVNEQAAKTMSLQLTALSGDMASFYNVEQKIADTALKSVFTGETESLKKFGIVMTEANLEAYRLAKGIKVSYSEMSQAQKVALRYNYVMQATALAQGDFARTSNSWANQLRLLRLMWEDLMVAMGTIFTHVLLPIIQALNTILAQIVRIAQGFASMFKSESPIQEIDKLSGGFSGLSDNIDDASESAKKYKKLITGFDELNILTSTGGGTGMDMSGAGFDMELEQPYDFNELSKDAYNAKKTLDEIIDSFNDFNVRLGEKLTASRAAVSEWGKNLAGGINSVVDGVQWNSIGANIGNGLNLIIDFFKNFWQVLDGYDIGVAIATMLSSTIQTIDWQGLTDTIIAKFNTIIDGLQGFINAIEIQTLVVELTNMFKRIATEVDWIKLGWEIGQLINLAITTAWTLITGVDLQLFATKLFEGFRSAIDTVDWELLGATIKQAILQLFNSLKESGLATEIGSAFGEFIRGIDFFKIFIESISFKGSITGGFLAGLLGIDGEKSEQIMEDLASIGVLLATLFEIIKDLSILNIGLKILALGESFFKFKEYFGAIINSCFGLRAAFLALSPIFSTLKAGAIAAFTAIKTGITSAISFIIANPITLVIAAIVALVALIATKGDEIQAAFNKLTEWIKTTFVRDWTEVFGGTLGSVLNGFIAVMEDIWGGAKDILNGLIDFIRGVFTGDWERAWKGVQEIFGGIFNALVGIAKAPLNLIIGLVNGMLNAIEKGINFLVNSINKLKINVPDWVPAIGGKTFGFNLKTVAFTRIPQLANGGVAYESTLANIGEYAGAKHNPEIVAPQSLLETIVNKGNEEVVSALAQMTRQLITAIGDVDMSVTIGDNVIAQSAARGNQAYKKRTGVALI